MTMRNEINAVDLAFVVDTPGSMGGLIAAAQNQMIAMLEALARAANITHTARSIDHKCQVHRIYFIAHSHTPIGPVGRLGSSKLMIISTSSALLGSARSGKTLGSE